MFSPPSYLEKFSRSYPKLFRRLTAMDERFAGLPLLNAMGDFFILTVQSARREAQSSSRWERCRARRRFLRACACLRLRLTEGFS